MTQVPSTFARRDLVPTVAHLPLPQWQRFRDWQAGLRRNDPATEDQLYAIKRGLQLANKMQLADTPDDRAINYYAELVEEIDTWHRINGKSPDDAAIAKMVERQRLDEPIHHIKFPFDPKIDPQLHMIRLPVPKRSERQAIELLQLLWLLLKGITIGVKADQDTTPPGRSHVPMPPPPTDTWPSTKRTEAPDTPEVGTPTEQLLPAPPLPALPPSAPPAEDWSKNPASQPAESAPSIHKGPELDSRAKPQILESVASEFGKDWSPVAPGKPQVNPNKQAKHEPTHPYYTQGNSIVTHKDPQALANKHAGTGQPANNEPRNSAGFKERVDFGEVIGLYNGQQPTQIGLIHYAKDGTVHIVPARP
jgi:hypothetical protein